MADKLPRVANRKTTTCRTWKVGDYFILPDNDTFKSVYKVVVIEQGDLLWAYFPETNEYLYTPIEYARKATKLHKALV